MAQDPEQLRAEIAQTRDSLGQDLDVLTEKVTPSRVVGRKVEETKGRLVGLKDRVMGQADSVRDSVSSGAGGSEVSAADRAQLAGNAVAGAPAQARSRTAGNPFAAGLVAFGVGLLVSGLIPGTAAEARGASRLKEAAEPLLEPLKEQAGQAVNEVKENLTPAVQDAAASVKESAAGAAEQTRGSATDAAHTVRDEATDSASTVKQAAGENAGTVTDQAKSSAGNVKGTAQRTAPKPGSSS